MFQMELFYISLDFLQATVNDFWDRAKSFSYLPISIIILILQHSVYFFSHLSKTYHCRQIVYSHHVV